MSVGSCTTTRDIDSPIIRKRTNSTAKPISCMGFRPQRSTKRNVAQYPGIRLVPAISKVKSVILYMLLKLEDTDDPWLSWIPIADSKLEVRTLEVFSPSP